jgi:hypothetical protein
MNHPKLRLLAVCAALAAPALVSVPAGAQPAQVIDDATLTRARGLFDQANKLYDAGRLAEAEVAYIQAWKLKKSFDVAGNLGNLEADLKRWRQAAQFLAYALREFPAGGKPAVRENLLRRQAEAMQYVGQLRIQVNRPGAEVFLDGTSLGVYPLQEDVFAEPGNHLIEARLEGLPPVQANVVVTKGRVDDVTINLAPKGANKAVIIAGGVIAGVAAVTGAVFAGLWASQGSSASSLAGMVPHTAPCPAGGVVTPATSKTCSDLVSALNNQATFGSVAVGTFVTAGAVGAATLIYGLVASPRGARSGLVVAPAVTAHGGGLFASGSF